MAGPAGRNARLMVAETDITDHRRHGLPLPPRNPASSAPVRRRHATGDPSNAPRWYRRIKTADWVAHSPLRVGSRVTFSAKFLGKQLVYTYEVIEFTPGESMTMRTAEGPFPMETTYTWAPVDISSTHMTLRNQGEPAGFSKLAAPLMSMAMKRAMRQDLQELKTVLESPWPPPASAVVSS